MTVIGLTYFQQRTRIAGYRQMFRMPIYGQL